MVKKILKSSVRAKYNRIWQRHIKIIASHIESPVRAKYLYINYYALTGLCLFCHFKIVWRCHTLIYYALTELFIKYLIKLHIYLFLVVFFEICYQT